MGSTIGTRAIWRHAALFCGLGALAACGGDSRSSVDAGVDEDAADAAPVEPTLVRCESRDGSRLRREFIEPSPGARQELRIIDSMHEVECTYQQESDGTFTCYPAVATGIVRFQDDACTSAIAGFTVGSTPSKFTRQARTSMDGCETIREFRLVGAPSAVTGGQGVFRVDPTGACVAQVAPTRDYYLAGPVLPASSFVNAPLSAVSTETHLSPLAFEGADGSSMCSFPTILRDNALETSCEIRLAADSEIRCVPLAGVADELFSDDACGVAASVATVGTCASAPPDYVFEDTAITCGNVTRAVREVTATEVPQVFDLVADVCTEQVVMGNSYFAVGDEVAAAELAPLSSVVETQDARLHRRLHTSIDFETFAGTWYDSKLDVDCRFGAAADGSLRCLPLTMTPSGFFSDSICTLPISLALVDECQTSVGFFAASGGRILSGVVHEDPVFRQGADCEPVTGTFYKPAFELAPTSFELGVVLPAP